METYRDTRAFTNSPKCVEVKVRLLAGSAQLNTGARVCIVLAILMLIFTLLRLTASALKLACSRGGWRPLVQHIKSVCIDLQALAKSGGCLCGKIRYIVVESIPGWLQKGVGYLRKPLSREERMVQEAAQVRLLTVWRIIFCYLYVCFASMVLFRVAWNTKQGLVSSLLRSDIQVEDAMEVVDQYRFKGYFLLSAFVFHECPRLLTWRNIYTWIVVTYLHDMVCVCSRHQG